MIEIVSRNEPDITDRDQKLDTLVQAQFLLPVQMVIAGLSIHADLLGSIWAVYIPPYSVYYSDKS